MLYMFLSIIIIKSPNLVANRITNLRGVLAMVLLGFSKDTAMLEP